MKDQSRKKGQMRVRQKNRCRLRDRIVLPHLQALDRVGLAMLKEHLLVWTKTICSCRHVQSSGLLCIHQSLQCHLEPLQVFLHGSSISVDMVSRYQPMWARSSSTAEAEGVSKDLDGGQEKKL